MRAKERQQTLQWLGNTKTNREKLTDDGLLPFAHSLIIHTPTLICLFAGCLAYLFAFYIHVRVKSIGNSIVQTNKNEAQKKHQRKTGRVGKYKQTTDRPTNRPTEWTNKRNDTNGKSSMSQSYHRHRSTPSLGSSHNRFHFFLVPFFSLFTFLLFSFRRNFRLLFENAFVLNRSCRYIQNGNSNKSSSGSSSSSNDLRYFLTPCHSYQREWNSRQTNG